jgi:Kef-type K+ transport system membrane component KefB
VLLFTIGLEFTVKDIAKTRYLVVALFGIIVPAVAGFFLATAFDFDFKASVFVGTALSATSIAITANVLREMGKLQTGVAKAIIGAAVIDDVLALLVLSVSEGIVSGELSLGSLLVVGAKAVGFVGIGIALGRLAVGRLILKLDGTRVAAKYPESVFIFAIMIAFLYALTAELVGLSAIVGAFLAGASFAGLKLKSGEIFREGSDHLQVIFASIFFVSLGVIMDLHVITLNLLWFVLALTATGTLAKIAGCGVPALFQGLGIKDSMILGVGMVPRGEVAMIVALIGLGQGLIDSGTYAALILMSLLTTIIPPLILRNWLFRADVSAPESSTGSGKET